jgi:flagellar basal-body rod modification protein FlgD
MSALTALTPTTPTNTGNSTVLNSVDMNQFLTLMITELQNQDPMNPMDNTQMLQQISEIRQIGATQQLQDSLQAVFVGQNLSTASGLIGKQVNALTDDGKNVAGVVDRVTVEVDPKDDSKRTLRVHMGTNEVQLSNVREILSS